MGKANRGSLGGEMKVRLDSKLLASIDAIAEREFTSRSEIMRQACVAYLREKGELEPHVPGPVPKQLSSTKRRRSKSGGESERP